MNNHAQQARTEEHVRILSLEIPARTLADQQVDHCDRHLHPWIAQVCHVAEQDVTTYRIRQRSLDARKKPNIRLIYKLEATIKGEAHIQENAQVHVVAPPLDQEHPLYHLPLTSPLPTHPVVVGTGPAGLMAAYLLALHGCKPIILDQGHDVDRRRSDIERFHETRQLNPDSNYLFGEGGAGTFSDGKLYTRVKDVRMAFLLDAYVAARAPRRILYDSHPHIGSDILPYMVKRLRQQIEAWGGEFRWEAPVSDVHVAQHRCQGVTLRSGEIIEAPVTIIACGHSARSLIETLARRGIDHRLKDFQIGCRIEHPQELIDQAQYGWIPPRTIVGAAEYTLTHRPPDGASVAGVTTFCMCPGGEIIAATSDEGQLCTNGMSRFLRNSPYANAGLIVNQSAADFSSVAEAFHFLKDLEQRAFQAGAGDDDAAPYRCPAQSAGAFARGAARVDTSTTSYRFGMIPARLDRLLPQKTTVALQHALTYFDRLIPGFVAAGTLLGVETRVSSPVRFERHPDTLQSSLPGLYPAGEGAGYAGGITSAALDGLRIAETMLTGKSAKRKAVATCDETTRIE